MSAHTTLSPSFTSIPKSVRLRQYPTMDDGRGDFTRLLERLSAGDRTVEEELMPQVYMELHRLAYAHFRGERTGHTLQPTALVHEVYLRLCRQSGIGWQNRGHFFRIAGRLMRRILVDHARQRGAHKRGDGRVALPIEDHLSISDQQLERAIEMDDLLNKLALMSPRQAQVVEMRFFAGLSEEEIGLALNVNIRTVKRDWFMARAWLYERLKGREYGPVGHR